MFLVYRNNCFYPLVKVNPPPKLVITEDASSGPAYYSKRQVFLHDSLLILMADGLRGMACKN